MISFVVNVFEWAVEFNISGVICLPIKKRLSTYYYYYNICSGIEVVHVKALNCDFVQNILSV